MKTINKKWLQYNNLMNEGEEGYNPYPKYASNDISSVEKKYTFNGYDKTKAQWIDKLLEESDRLEKVIEKGNEHAIEIVKASVEKLQNFVKSIA